MKKYLLRRKAAPEDLIFWPTGLLAAGLWQYRQEKKEEDVCAVIDLVLSAYCERWFQKGSRILWLDDLLAGETMLALYEVYRKNGPGQGIRSDKEAEQYRQAVDKMADYALHYPTDETGSFLYRAGQDNGYVFVDTIGLACPFLYRYGTVCDRPETMEAAVKQIVNFLAYGMDADTGLPYHGYSVADDHRLGKGRGLAAARHGLLHDDTVRRRQATGALCEAGGDGCTVPAKGRLLCLAAAGGGRSGGYFRHRHDLCGAPAGNRAGYSGRSSVWSDRADRQECFGEIGKKRQSVPLFRRVRRVRTVSAAL